MAEAYAFTPVIRLPKSKESTPLPSIQRQQALQIQDCDPRDLIVSKTLYFAGLSVSANEIRTLLHRYQPIRLSIQDQGRGYIQFADAKIADRVYSLYNGFTFPDNSSLHFQMSEDGNYEPEAKAYFLQAKNLPHYIDNDALYNLFRPFGPLSLCKLVVEGRAFCGTAFIQYFEQQDSDEARKNLHGKSLDGHTLHVTSLMHSGKKSDSLHDSTERTTTTSTTSESGYVDYLNLYIKNLDPSVRNNDLYTMFKKFGNIVSARVMSNPATGQSKGYGFVSYEKPEEAAAALQEMKGKMVANKPLIVAYHEPKKSRQDKQTPMGTTPAPATATPSFPSTLPFMGQFGTVMRPVMDFAPFVPPVSNPNTVPFFPQMSRHPYDAISQAPMTMPVPTPVSYSGHDNLDPVAMNIKSIGQKRPPPSQPMHRKFSGTEDTFGNPPLRLSPPILSQPVSGINSNGPILSFLASGTHGQTRPGPGQRPLTHHMAPLDMKTSHDRPTLTRRGSQESLASVMTETTANYQRQRLTEAVMKCGDYGKRLHDIVYLLSTLKRQERSRCLFSQDFLRERIQDAIEALDICDDGSGEEGEEENEGHEQNVPSYQTQRLSPMAAPFAAGSTALSSATNLTPAAVPRPMPFRSPGVGRTPPLHRVSKAIPIVPPPDGSPSAHAPATVPQSPAPEARQDDDTKNNASQVESVLASIDGKPLHERKQQLGDRLFPLVKATGTKQAIKVTIRLLDTIDLYELAHLMYDPVKLKEQVDKAYAALK